MLIDMMIQIAPNVLIKKNAKDSALDIMNTLETSSCPLCKTRETSIMHLFEPFRVVSCQACDFTYLNPRLKESAARTMYESSEYFSKKGETGYEDYGFQENSLRLTFRRFLENLKRHKLTSGKLLEIGSGYGFFLSEAMDFFTSVSGIELSSEAAAHAHDLSGAEMFNCDVNALPPEVRDFDVIVAINVIEHIYDPVELLLHAKNRLRKGGWIIIATPDIGSFWHKIMGRKWPSFKIPEHVAFYTKKTLALLLERAGFSNIKPITFPHAFPLELITRQFKIPLPDKFSKIPVWLPKTMIALAAEYRGE